MPAIFDSLVKNQHLTPHVAWRVAFIVPFIIITAIAMGLLFTAEDTPSGKWADRHRVIDAIAVNASSNNSIMNGSEKKATEAGMLSPEKTNSDIEGHKGQTTAVQAAAGEVVVAPTFKEAMGVVFSLQTWALAAPYACSFGKFTFHSPL
jgi:NNP family nitrate/nitrite transporter-like MFS transporter